MNRGEVSRVLHKPFDGDDLRAAVQASFDMRKRVAEQYSAAVSKDHAKEELQLRDCFANDLLQLALQPILTASERRIVAFEALLRSRHPALSSPCSILQASERQGQLGLLGAAVAQRAEQWLRRLPPNVKLFVNLHPTELGDPDGLTSRLGILAPQAGRVVLEITERSEVMNVEAWEESTNRLCEMGFSLAVDDLGAGYSSLSVLAALKPQFIKIDMSIIRGVDRDRHKRSLVELLCRFGEATCAQVIAEGIETEAEADAVSAVGVHLVQGYLYGRPQLKQSGPQS